MSLKAKLGILALGLMLSGCMQATNYQPAPEASLKPADKAQLAKARYEKVAVAEPFRRAIVDYHRKEMPGSIVVDSDNHYLYLVQDGGKAIRYGITVGEEYAVNDQLLVRTTNLLQHLRLITGAEFLLRRCVHLVGRCTGSRSSRW